MKNNNLIRSSCVNVDFGTYEKTILIGVPEHMKDYVKFRSFKVCYMNGD